MILAEQLLKRLTYRAEVKSRTASFFLIAHAQSGKKRLVFETIALHLCLHVFEDGTCQQRTVGEGESQITATEYQILRPAQKYLAFCVRMRVRERGGAKAVASITEAVPAWGSWFLLSCTHKSPKNLLSKDHACSRLTLVCAKRTVSTYASLEVGWRNQQFSQFNFSGVL